MLPSDLKPKQFSGYPPLAQQRATDFLPALRRLPITFVPSFLRELIEYDFKFPAEREAIDRELSTLDSLSAAQVSDWFQALSAIRLSTSLESFDWVNAPAQFVEQLSAYLWSTHQLDAFRKAATDYAERLRVANPPKPPVVPRLGIVVIGQGVTAYDEPLFRKLRPHGAHYTAVNPDGGLKQLLDAAAERARVHTVPYGHWYIDGGVEAPSDPALTCVSYHALQPVRESLLRRIHADVGRPGMGPEALRTLMAQTSPADLGLNAADPVLDRFRVKLLTEGSGTQIFSTSFTQWAAREALRRAQPLTLLVRFAPRQRQRPMNELLAGARPDAEVDPLGSLVDGDMGAYYTYLNQQRLPGAEKSSFVVWFEGHNQALAIGPATPRGTESSRPADLRQVLSWSV